MIGEVKRNSFSKMTRKSISSLRKSFSKITKKIKSDLKKGTIEIEGKKFKNYKELVDFAIQESNKAEKRYDETYRELTFSIQEKVEKCHEQLGSKSASEDFDNKFLNDIHEIKIAFYSIRFLKSEDNHILGQDKNEKHNKEDFKLLCKNPEFLDFLTSTDLKPVPESCKFRSDGSQRERRCCSRVAYAVMYLPILMTSYDRDYRKMNSRLTKLFQKMDKYVQDYQLKQWSKQPQKLRERQSLLETRLTPTQRAWSKKPKKFVPSMKDPTKVLGQRQHLIGNERTEKERKMAADAKAKHKEELQRELKEKLKNMQQSSTSGSSSPRRSRGNITGKRKSTVTFSKKIPSR